MGSILTNGVFLPAEGERNCYEGLAANWVALDGLIGGYSAHAADLTIHVTAADKEAWNGKADASALASYYTKSEADTLLGAKANDADVMHKSGAETIAGVKTFSDIPIFATFDGIRFRCAHNSNAYVTFRNANQANPGSIILSANDGTTGTTIHLVDKTLIPYTLGDIDLGTKIRKWKSLNGLNPGALSLPDLTAGVDISGYFTTGTTENTYTPTVNGWVCVHGISSGTSGIFVENSNGFYASANSIVAYTGTDRYVNLCFPVIGGESYNIVLKSVNTSIAAKFFPCQGNV